ncbi:MAG: tetratricopeptide repeat protein [Armatimonadota bacterium]
MTRISTILMFGLALALLAGCTSRSERLYRRAETFLAQGQHKMAADEYQRIVAEEADSALADDALYKLAYVYAEELDQPAAGLAQYRRLVDNYPRSPWVDDALMRVMAIQRQTLAEPEAVRRTWSELCERFEDRKGLCARGLLEVARAHFDAEDYAMAAATSVELTTRYADERTPSAQAALLHARAAERMGIEQAEVEKLYETLIERYPDTHAAAMAKRNIGWMYYGKREEQQQQHAAEVERRSRIIRGVPAHAPRETELLQAISTLRAALAQRGEQRTIEWLTALHGAPFAIVFDPQQPAAGADPLQGSPLEIVTDALGFAYNRFSGATAENAFDTVHQAVLQGHPVIIRHGSPPRWMIVTGYDLSQQRVHFMPPGRDSYAAMSREQFLAGWRTASGRGSGVAGAEPFYQFSLAARLRQPSDEELLQAVVDRAAEITQRTTLSGAPAGATAWESAGAWLDRRAEAANAGEGDSEASATRVTAASWLEGSLGPWLALARPVTPILQKAEGAMPALANATARHTELLEEAELVARKIEEATTAEEDAGAKWEAAAAQARYIAALHQRLADQLATAASGG